MTEMSPVAKLKAVKNAVEIEGMKNAHVRKTLLIYISLALCDLYQHELLLMYCTIG